MQLCPAWLNPATLIFAAAVALRRTGGNPAWAPSLSALGLNLVMGYAKLYSLGHGGFMLVGAYGTAVALNRYRDLKPDAVIDLLANDTFAPDAGESLSITSTTNCATYAYASIPASVISGIFPAASKARSCRVC